MGLAKARVRTFRLRQQFPVIVVKGLQHLLRGFIDLLRERFTGHGDHFHDRLLLKASEGIPPPPGRVARKTGLEQQEHVAGSQLIPQRLEDIRLRCAQHPQTQPPENLTELIRANLVVRPVRQKLVDRGIAHHDSGLPGLFHKQPRPYHRVFAFREQRQPGRVTSRLHGSFHQEAVEHTPHGDQPIEVTLAYLTTGPASNQRIAREGAATHLQEWRKHKEREHRHDRHKNQKRLLIAAKNVERAGHEVT